MPLGKVMTGLIGGAGCIYKLIRYTEMKEKVKVEYLIGVHKVLETKWNSGNIIKGINI